MPPRVHAAAVATAPRTPEDAAHNDEQRVEQGHRCVDAARDPRALRDDDRKSGDEQPAREEWAASTAHRVQDRHESTNCEDGGDPAVQGVRVDEHRDPE